MKRLLVLPIFISFALNSAFAGSPQQKPNFDDQLQILSDLGKIDLTEKEIAYERKASSCDRHKSFGGSWVGDEDCGSYDINKVQKSTVNTENFKIGKLTNGNYAILPKTPKPNNGAKLVKIGESMGYAMYDWSTSETVKTMSAKGLLPQQTSTQSAGKQNNLNKDIFNNDLLTGDVRLACEAILCLSTGNRPSECNPSIKRYFSIKHKKLHDTINARKNFLNLCPAVGDDVNMPSLVNAIANGAGQCDLESLNKTAKRQCRVWYDRDTGDRKSYCNPQLPTACSAYYNHAYTDIAKPKWQCTRTEKEPALVRKEGNNFKIEYTEKCVAGKWGL